MAIINPNTKEIKYKIVYYGPGLSGKTTNLEVIHDKMPPTNCGELTSIATEGDRTLFVEITPPDLNSTKLKLYTVPGQVYYNATRKLVLQGVDGIIFVADSQHKKMQENKESLENLVENLESYGLEFGTIPLVFLYNKQDLPGKMTVEEMNQALNKWDAPYFEGVAFQGKGVFPALKEITKQIIARFDEKYKSSLEMAETNAKVAVENSVVAKTELSEKSITDSDEVIKNLLTGEVLKDVKLELLDLSHQIFEKEVLFKNVSIDRLVLEKTQFQKKVSWEQVKIKDLVIEEVDKSPCSFHGELQWKEVSLEGERLNFRNICFKEAFLFENVVAPKATFSLYGARLMKGIKINGSEFNGIDLREAVLAGEAKFSNNKFHGHVNAWNTRFEGGTEFKECIFYDKARFRAAIFSKPTKFVEVHFHKEGFFGEAIFQDEINFYKSEFLQDAHFHQARFYEETNFSKTTILGEAIFNEVSFKGRLTAREAIWKKLYLDRSICYEEVDFTQIFCEDPAFNYAVFRGVANFPGGVFKGLCDFTGTRFEQKCNFKGTKFQGELLLTDIDAEDMVISWDQINGKLQSELVKDYAKARADYATLKTIFERKNLYDEMDEAYFRFKQMDRKALSSSQWLKKVFSALFLDLGCGYGTRPWRIILASLSVISFFGLTFTSFANEFVYMGPESILVSFNSSNAFYFSIATFTTMGFGDWAPKPDSFMRFFVTIEAFLGIFTMSLFIGVLSRKIIR